jgi:cohesin loading factor subunit SCC2
MIEVCCSDMRILLSLTSFAAPLEKLTSLLEDIFEAEDALAPDAATSESPSEFFSPYTADCTQPLLHPSVIKKLTKYIGHVTRPTKRVRLSAGARDGPGGTPSKMGRMAEVDIDSLGRVLKLLERSVRAGEDLDPFVGYGAASKDQMAWPRKSKKQKKMSGNEGGTENSADGEMQEVNMMEIDELPKDLTDSDFETLERLLDIARDSILAADCCIALLGSDRLTKQVSMSNISLLHRLIDSAIDTVVF